MIMTSYYYSVCGIIVVSLYYLYRYIDTNNNFTFKQLIINGIKYVLLIFIGISMAGILFNPTAYTLLQGRGESTSTISLIQLLTPHLKIYKLFNGPYSIGVSMIGFVSLLYLFYTKKKSNIVFATSCSIIIFMPIFMYILNGGLYLREKCFIPFIPVFGYMIAVFLNDLYNKKINTKKFTIFLLIILMPLYYYKEKQLKNINLKLKKQKILILGKSGSGKSTLFKLLMRYYEIPRNQITINGYDINDYKDDVIKHNFSYISQNEILYTDSIYNNLKIDKNITEEQIIEISKKCFIDEFLNDLGLNMLIEENGYNLSGGQRQRIILARALLKNFEVLIIDEGLSQMDINLERKILKNLFKMYENKMIIVISHRLDNMDLYDRVIELKNGEIVKDVFKNE